MDNGNDGDMTSPFLYQSAERRNKIIGCLIPVALFGVMGGFMCLIPAVEAFGLDLVWFGIVTVVGAEIGLLTPPLGISCFVIKSTLREPDVTLFDVFAGAFPFAVVMLLVLVVLIAYPGLSLALL